MDVAAMQAAMQQVEEACADFQVPSTRAAAEAILSQFRETPRVLPLCQFILERSNDAMVQFQTALAMRRVIVREWTQYERQTAIGLRDFLIHYVTARNDHLRAFVRESVLHVTALLVKLYYLDPAAGRLETVNAQVDQLCASPSLTLRSLGASLLGVIVDEFSSLKATAVGITLESHYRARKAFEASDLGPIFSRIMNLLAEQASGQGDQGALATAQSREYLRQTLGVAEAVLYWDHSTINANTVLSYFQKNDSDTSTEPLQLVFSPPQEWRPILLNPNTLGVFFSLYHQSLHHGEHIGHIIRQCLVCLAGLNDRSGSEPHLMFLEGFFGHIHGLLLRVNQASEVGPEVHALCQMLRRLLSNNSLALLTRLPSVNLVIEMALQLTLNCLQRTTSGQDEDTWSKDSFTELLALWIHLVAQVAEARANQRTRPSPEIIALHALIAESAWQLFSTYVDLHVNRDVSAIQEHDLEGDVDSFKDELELVAQLGRTEPERSLTMLITIANQRLGELSQAFANSSALTHIQWEGLHERTHWLMILFGYVLADSGEGELPLVPDSIMKLSVLYEKTPANDLVLLAIASLFQLIDGVSLSPSSPAFAVLSPQVVETSMWLLKRWIQTYLFFSHQDYGRPSFTLNAAYGTSGERGPAALAFAMDKVIVNLTSWFGNKHVVESVVGVLERLAARRAGIRRMVVSSAQWPALFETILGALIRVPSDTQAQLMVCLCNIAFCQDAGPTYYRAVFDHVEQRLSAPLDAIRQGRAERAYVAQELCHGIGLLAGLAMASDQQTTNDVFAISSARFSELVQVLSVYPENAEVTSTVLRYFGTYAEHQMSFITAAQCRVVYDAVLALLRTYATHNSGKLRRVDAHSEDEASDELLVLLRLLKNLMSRDFLDWSEDGPGEVLLHRDEDAAVAVQVSQVIFAGMGIIVPLLNGRLLQIPQVSDTYFALVQNLCEVYPQDLLALDPAIFTALVRTIEYGTEHYVTSSARSAYDSLFGLASHVFKMRSQGHAVAEVSPLLEVQLAKQLNRLLFHDFESSLLDPASEALFATLCAQPTSVAPVINALLAHFAEQPEAQARLQGSFQTLFSVPLDLARSSMNAFRANLEQFLLQTRGVVRLR